MADLISARPRSQVPAPPDPSSPADRHPATACEPTQEKSPGVNGLQADAALVELLFFAYRGFTAEPDAILGRLGFGRAHHRVMHFVTRTPGLRVADLLDILRITKQSLARVLRQLIVEGYVVQKPGTQDRRERLLYPTAKGRLLADQLVRIQIERLEQALAAAGPSANKVAREFLRALVADGDRMRAEGDESRAHKGAQERDV